MDDEILNRKILGPIEERSDNTARVMNDLGAALAQFQDRLTSQSLANQSSPQLSAPSVSAEPTTDD